MTSTEATRIVGKYLSIAELDIVALRKGVLYLNNAQPVRTLSNFLSIFNTSDGIILLCPDDREDVSKFFNYTVMCQCSSPCHHMINHPIFASANPENE